VKSSLKEGEEQPHCRRREASGKEKSSLREGEELLQVRIAASGKEKSSLIAAEVKLREGDD
jgi:hypothetical protein